MIQRVAIVGLGLIGGSLAKLLHKKHPSLTCFGVDADKITLAQALKDGVISEGFASHLDLPTDVHLVVICTPIEATRPIISDLLALLPPTCILTDVASVKQYILDDFEFPNVVGGHPIAGTEFSGYMASEASILDNAPFILVSNLVNTDACSILSQFLEHELGFRVAELSAPAHDEQIAATSHLPYLIACLTTLQAQLTQPHRFLLGPGFASTTRVAKSNPDWGVAVCKTNKQALLQGLKELQASNEALVRLIEAEDWVGLRAVLATACQFRREI